MSGTYVALLRGINVGRAKRIRMADLRAALAAAGFGDVRTLLQSGNVVLTPPRTAARGAADEQQVVNGVHDVIEKTFGFDVAVVVRTAQELAALVASCPVTEVLDGSRFVVAFLSQEHPPSAFRAPQLPAGSRERWWPPAPGHPREVLADCPDGLQDSPLVAHIGRLGLPGHVTVRNWNTVTALAALATPAPPPDASPS